MKSDTSDENLFSKPKEIEDEGDPIDTLPYLYLASLTFNINRLINGINRLLIALFG